MAFKISGNIPSSALLGISPLAPAGRERTLGSDPAEVRRSDSEPDFCEIS
jgi:hypothetical protein